MFLCNLLSNAELHDRDQGTGMNTHKEKLRILYSVTKESQIPYIDISFPHFTLLRIPKTKSQLDSDYLLNAYLIIPRNDN